MKVCQLASYEKNIGDNAAIYNIRSFFDDVEWVSYDLNNFYKIGNNVKESCKILNKLNTENDAFIIGGGGLIEGGIYNNFETGWKLPFNKETLSYITKPIICVALGVNYFRGIEGLNKEGWNNLKLLIDKSTFFSVRNDGSADILSRSRLKNFEVIPDPGLIFKKSKNRKDFLVNGIFQPAMNLTPAINLYRNLTKDNLLFLENFCLDNNLLSLPHTPKDFLFFKEIKNLFDNKTSLLEMLKEKNYYKSLNAYKIYDYCIAMRGHGQLISCGLNVPSIYLSTQNKVLGYSVKNGYGKFTVDTTDGDWKNKLIKKHNKLINSKDFLCEWYDINEANIKNFKIDFEKSMKDIKALLR